MRNDFKKIFLNENFYFFLLFCFVLLVSFYYFYTIDQRAINSALTLSNEIIYEDKFTITNIIHHNTWILTFSFIKIFNKLRYKFKFFKFFYFIYLFKHEQIFEFF